MVDSISRGMLLDDGGYWGLESRKIRMQTESLVRHYEGLYSLSIDQQEREDSSDKTSEEVAVGDSQSKEEAAKINVTYADELWSLIVDGKAGAINADIFFGALVGALSNVGSNQARVISQFQKILEENSAIQDEVLNIMEGGRNVDVITNIKKRKKTRLANSLGKGGLGISAGGQKENASLSPLNAIVVEMKDGSDFRQQVSRINEVYRSTKGLLLKEFTDHEFAFKLFQNCPNFIGRCSAELLLMFAINNPAASYCIFTDTELCAKVLPVVSANVQKIIAKIPGFSDDKQKGFFQGIFMNAFSSRITINALIATGLLKDAASTGFAVPESFADTLEGRQEKERWDAIVRIRAYFYRENYEFATVDVQLGKYLQQHLDVAIELCGGDAPNITRLKQLMNLHQDPIGFIRGLAKNTATRDFITENIGEIVLHVQERLTRECSSATQVKKQLHRLLHIDTGVQCKDARRGRIKPLGRSLRRYLDCNFLSTLQGRPVGQEDVYKSLFVNDYVRGQLNFDGNVLREILAANSVDPILAMTIASDENLWKKVKSHSALATIKGKSDYFIARSLLDRRGGLDSSAITEENVEVDGVKISPVIKQAILTLIAVRPNLFWPKIKKPRYTNWMRFVRLFSKQRYTKEHEAYCKFNQSFRNNALLSGKFKPINEQITEAQRNASALELSDGEDNSSIYFSKYLLEQVKNNPAILVNDKNDVLKHIICEGASPSYLLEVLGKDSSGKLINYVVKKQKYLNKLLRNTTKDLEALPDRLSSLPSVLHYFNNVDGGFLVIGVGDQQAKVTALQEAFIKRILELISSVKFRSEDFSKVYNIATKIENQQLLMGLLRNFVAESVTFFKKLELEKAGKEAEKKFIEKILLLVLTNAVQLNQSETTPAFGNLIRYFIDEDSWLAQCFFENISIEMLCRCCSEEVQKKDGGLLIKLLDKLNKHKQISKISVVVGWLEYNDISGNVSTITKILTPEILALLSLKNLLHFFNDKGEFFVGTNEELQKQVGTKVLEKISDAAPYEEFSKLFILRLSEDAAFARQICTKFAANWTNILSATTSEVNQTKQRQFTRELFLEVSERGKAFRQQVSIAVLLDLKASRTIEAQEWSKIIATLRQDGNRHALISLWQQQSDWLEYFAFAEWAKLNDGADFKQFVADPELTLRNFLGLFDDTGQALYELGTALNIVINSIGEKIKAGAAATISLADIDKCSKLPGMDFAFLVDFYMNNWEVYQAQDSVANLVLIARWLSSDNACGTQFRQKFSVEFLQKISLEKLVASIKLLWRDNQALVIAYLRRLDFADLQSNSAAISELINRNDYLAKTENFDEVLRFFDADGRFCCGDVAGKQKVVDRLLQLLSSQFSTITAEQVRKLSAIHDDKISEQLEQWATQNWDVFAGLPVDLRVAIINARVHRGRIFEVEFLVGHFSNFMSLVETDSVFAQGLSSGAYSGLLLAAINNKKETQSLIELIKQYGKYEALILLLNKQNLQFVQQRENFGFFTPLCEGDGLDALEKSIVDAIDFIKFFDGAGKIIPEFAAILTRPRIVAKIVSTGNFSLQGTEVLTVARQKTGGAVVDQQQARELRRANIAREAAEDLERYLKELGERDGDIEIKIKDLEQQLEQARAEQVQNIVKINQLETSLSAVRKEKSLITRAKEAALARQENKKPPRARCSKEIMEKLSGKLNLFGADTSATSGGLKSVRARFMSPNAIKAQLDFAQIKVLINLAVDNIVGLELAIAQLLGVLPKCKGGEASECQTLLDKLLKTNKLVIPSIIAALRSIDFSEQLKFIRILDSCVAAFFESLFLVTTELPKEETAAVISAVKYFLQFAFDPKAQGASLPGKIATKINDFFAKHCEYYDYLMVDAKADELLSMMQNNSPFFVRAVNSKKLSEGALVKLFSQIGILGKKKAQNAQDLINAIADQYGSGLLLFAYLAALSPEARSELVKYEAGFVKRWWGGSQAEFIAKISEVQFTVLRTVLSYSVDDVKIAEAVFASADGLKRCIDCLSSEELKQYEKLITLMLPQIVVAEQKKQDGTGARAAKQSKVQYSSPVEEIAARFKLRGGAQAEESGVSQSNFVVTVEEREKFIKGLDVELVAKLLGIGSTLINQRLCCVDISVLLMTLSCCSKSEIAKKAVREQIGGITTLLNRSGIDLSGFKQQHWAILIEAGVELPLSVYQANRELVGEFLFGKDSSELLKKSTLKACPAFFVIDAKQKTIGGFDIGKFSDIQLRVLLESLAKDQQATLADMLLVFKPQLIASLFNECVSDRVTEHWNVFKGWLSQQLGGRQLSREQVEKLLACENSEIKQWLRGVFAQQPGLVEDIFKTQQSVVGKEAFFLPYLTTEKVSVEDVQKCLGSQNGEMQMWLGDVYARAPRTVIVLLNVLDAGAVQQNYCLFKSVILAVTNVDDVEVRTTISSEMLAKFFTASGECIEVAKEDIAKLFEARPEVLVALIKYKYADTVFIEGLVQNNFALLQDLLPQLTDTTVIRSIIEYGNVELWGKLFGNEELFRVAISRDVVSALNEQHYMAILSNKTARAMLRIVDFGSVATACGVMLSAWCSRVDSLDEARKQIIRDCFKDEQVLNLLFSMDRINVSQVAALAKIGDEVIVNILFENVSHGTIAAFFSETNYKQLQSIADGNPAFAKIVFAHGKPEVFKATFITGRSSEYKQKQFRQWLVLAVDKKDIRALDILLAVQEQEDRFLLLNTYNELAQDKKVVLMEFSPSFVSAMASLESNNVQPRVGSSTSVAMHRLAAMDYIDIYALLKVKDEHEWAKLFAHAEFVKSLRHEFNFLINRKDYDEQTLLRLSLFLRNKFACTKVELRLVLRAIAVFVSKGRDVVWQDVQQSLRYLDERLASTDSAGKSVVARAKQIVMEKLKLLESQVPSEVIEKTMEAP